MKRREKGEWANSVQKLLAQRPGDALLRERQHRAPSWERRQPRPGQRPVAAAGSRGSPARARAGSARPRRPRTTSTTSPWTPTRTTRRSGCCCASIAPPSRCSAWARTASDFARPPPPGSPRSPRGLTGAAWGGGGRRRRGRGGGEEEEGEELEMARKKEGEERPASRRLRA